MQDKLFSTLTFRSTGQRQNEPIDDYIQRLRTIALNCDFDDLEKELYLQVISKATSPEVKKEAIHGAQRDPLITLAQLIAFARLEQATASQTRSLNSDRRPHEANHTRHSKQQQSLRNQSKQDYERKQLQKPSSAKCHCCGRDHIGQPCKAKGKNCDHCGKPNHFQSVCMSKQRGEPPIAQVNRPPRQPNRRHHTNHVGQLELELPTHEQPRSNLSFVLRPGPELPHKWLQVNGVDLNFLLDTGSTITTIDEATYQKWQHNLPQLERFTDQIQGYPQQPLAVVGQFTATVAFGVSQTSEIIAVVAGKAVNLLSYRACVALDLVTINPQASQTCFSVRSLPEQYPSLFKNAIGRLTDITISLRIDTTVEPVVQKPRHTPYHLREKIEAKLAKLVKDGVIRKAKGPIFWVSSIVPILKPNGDVRITTDSRAANAAIQRTRHPMPTPDDISMAVTGATLFSKLDIKESFYILQLAEECKYITVFRTHMGLYKLWHTSLFCDASPVGLGCILWQTGPPPDNTKVIVKCDSRTLTEVEQRYSQQEKEGLATVWACEKNEVYLIGYKFDLITDNKGIELIYSNPKSKPPPRIQRMRLRLSPFDFNIIHKPGTQNISDYLSRHPLHTIDDVQHARLYDAFAIQVAHSLVPNCLRLEDLQQATDADPNLKLLIWYIAHRRDISTSRPLQHYRKVFNQWHLAASLYLKIRNC